MKIYICINNTGGQAAEVVQVITCYTSHPGGITEQVINRWCLFVAEAGCCITSVIVQHPNTSTSKTLQSWRNHYQDFGLHYVLDLLCHQSWKSTCDGIGGTVKRLAAQASLQILGDSQILFPLHPSNVSPLHPSTFSTGRMSAQKRLQLSATPGAHPKVFVK